MMTWLLAFLVFPLFGIIIFAIWGRNPYHHRTKEDYYQLEKKYIDLYNYGLLYKIQNTKEETINRDFLTLAMFNYYTCYEPVFANDKIEVLGNAKSFYDAVFEAVDKAEKTICLQYYILHNGFFFNTLMAKLIEKANQGTEIYILYDRFGCMGKLDYELMLNFMTHNNIHVAFFESLKDYKIRSTTNFRSHRKFLICDDKFAVYGGSNIGDEYLSMKNDAPNWIDLNFRIQGQVINRFLASFCSDWQHNAREAFIWKYGMVHHFAGHNKFLKFLLETKRFFLKRSMKNIVQQIEKKPKQERDLFQTFKEKYQYFNFNDQSKVSLDFQNSFISFINTGPIYYKSILTEQIIGAIARANKKIRIITPYLNPNDEIVSALKSAAMAGVDIEIVTPGVRNSQWYLLYMNRMNYWKLYDANIKILEYDGFIHSKLIIIDDELALIGTFNLDLRSLSSNFESMIVVQSEKITKALKQYFREICMNVTITSQAYLQQKRSNFGNLVTYLLKLIQPLL